MEQLIRLLKEGVSAAHTIHFVKNELISAGFEELNMGEKWKLQPGKGYYVNLYDTNCVAFRTGENMTNGKSPVFKIAMAHSDYPCFQIKPNPNIACKNVTKLNVEIYGGMYQKSWLDRPLGIAGSLIMKGKSLFSPDVLLYKSSRPLCIIPSLAIHMERELNKKGALDTAKELVPLTALREDMDLLQYIAEEACVKCDDILDFDLYTYVMEEPVGVGLDEAMLSSPRLDNLTSVAAIVSGLKKCERVGSDIIGLIAVFDNEEIGSRSKQGADSELLSWILNKVGQSWSDGFDKCDNVEKNFVISVDVAHATHPNYPEKSDVTNQAPLGKGMCIKRSVGQKYGTTAKSSAMMMTICDKYEIPYTIAMNRTGIPGGSTLGPIVSSHLPYPCGDIGMPILSMHSACELGAYEDYKALQKFVKMYFEE